MPTQSLAQIHDADQVGAVGRGEDERRHDELGGRDQVTAGERVGPQHGGDALVWAAGGEAWVGLEGLDEWVGLELGFDFLRESVGWWGELAVHEHEESAADKGEAYGKNEKTCADYPTGDTSLGWYWN